MTPTLTPITYQQARLMDRGTFTLFHAWDMGDGFTLEYWRGVDSNGACLRTLHEGDCVRITHYAEPGAAIRVLRLASCPVPGVPAMTDEERREAEAQTIRNLRAGHVSKVQMTMPPTDCREYDWRNG